MNAMPQPTAAILTGTDQLAAVYQLKIHLLGISPQICRRVLVRGDTTLAELHHVFQVAMGWENGHLHRFKLLGKEYGMPYVGGSDNRGKCEGGGFSLASPRYSWTVALRDSTLQLP